MTRLCTIASLPLTALTLASCAARGAPVGSFADEVTASEAARNHVACFSAGIDAIGGGDPATGEAIWSECFTEDFAFNLSFGWGDPLVCPGEACPFPDTMTSVQMRAALAQKSFVDAGFVQTVHLMSNVEVALEGEQARVTAYLNPWHFSPDGDATIGLASWAVTLAQVDGAWRIAGEDLRLVGGGYIPAMADDSGAAEVPDNESDATPPQE